MQVGLCGFNGHCFGGALLGTESCFVADSKQRASAPTLTPARVPSQYLKLESCIQKKTFGCTIADTSSRASPKSVHFLQGTSVWASAAASS